MTSPDLLASALRDVLPPGWRASVRRRGGEPSVVVERPGARVRYRVEGRMLMTERPIGSSWEPVGFESRRRLDEDVGTWAARAVVERVVGLGLFA